jgi:hypothetical protein
MWRSLINLTSLSSHLNLASIIQDMALFFLVDYLFFISVLAFLRGPVPLLGNSLDCSNSQLSFLPLNVSSQLTYNSLIYPTTT